MKKVFYPIVMAATLTSCAASHSGIFTGSAALSSANFTYTKKEVTGRSTATYILGIGGLAKQTLVDQAKQAMLTNNELKNGEALANVSVNFKNATYLFVYHTVTCIVTADIVAFNK